MGHWRLPTNFYSDAPCTLCGETTKGIICIEGKNIAVCYSPGCAFLKEYEDDDCIDGRFLEAVNEYASTCDGCSELAMHESMIMDQNTQFGYCEECVEKGNVPKDFIHYTEEF